MAAPLPGFVTSSRAGRRVRVTDHPKVLGPDVVVKSDQTDAGSTRTSLLRPAYCLVKVTSTGKYVAADDSTGDRNAAASVTALITNPGGGAWDGTLTIKGPFAPTTGVAVTLSADNTDAAVVTKINAAFAALDPELGSVIASVVSNRVVVTTRGRGAGQWLNVSHGTVATGWGTAAVGTTGVGTDADYVVSEDYVDLLDGNAAAVDGFASTTRAGHYDAANLLRATGEALVVLARRGSILDGTPTLVG